MSGKIEDTRANTVLAYSDTNGKTKRSVLIPSITKREIVRFYRQRGKVNINFYLKLFVIGLFHLLRGVVKKSELITIDEEYEGHDNMIKNMLLMFIHKNIDSDFDKNMIQFNKITKKSKAHELALKVYKNVEKEDKIITKKEIIELL